MIKWNPFHRPKRFLFVYSVCLFLLFGLGLLFPSFSASAVSVFSYTGERTFFVPGDSGPTIDQAWPSTGTTTSLLGAGNGRVFSGYRFSFHPTVPSDIRRYWVLNLEYHMNIDRIYWVQFADNTLPMTISVNGISGTCSHTRNDIAFLVNCTVQGDYLSTSPDSVSARFGTVDSYVEHFRAGLNGGTPSAITVSYINYEITSSNDPAVDLLVTQNGLIEETNSLLEQQIDAQQQANDQQQEQYEAEKQEEAEREEAATDAQTGTFLGSLSNLLFPFTNFFNMLGGQSCFTPTKINSWLHTTGAEYCPWFSTDVTNTVSTVLGAFSTILIFGFIIKWLNRSEVN